MLDASWHLEIWPILADFKRAGGSIVWVAYDLIPRNYPQFCHPDLVTSFTRWVELLQLYADAVLCISRTTAEIIRAEMPPYIAARVDSPRISYFWLGSELDGVNPQADRVRPALQKLGAAGEAPFYFYVSTIEPRKNHAYALDAFDLLWAQGSTARMVIVGRAGWHSDAFVARVKRHPAYGTSLFMYNDVSDTELAWLYENGNGLLFTSIIEGFGLPIVEALQQGVPVFASDIPVFREIGAEGVTFVDLANPASLAEAIAAHVEQGAQRIDPVDWLNWAASTEQFWTRVENCLAEAPDRTVLIP
jgi:alpha-1,2-rhamnosyltransferase